MIYWITKFISFKDVSMGLYRSGDYKPVGWIIYKHKYLNIPFTKLRFIINIDKQKYMYGLMLPTTKVNINENRYDQYLSEKRDHDIKKLLPPEKEDIKIFNIKIGEKTTKYI
jgi:hypothetical protein